MKDVGYPGTVVVVDFESYFDNEYGLKTHSTVEYIQDKRWEALALAYGIYPETNEGVAVGEESIDLLLRSLRSTYGDDLAGCTVVMQNAMFDASVLALRYGMHPKHIIDSVCLARAWHTRTKHGLAAMAERFGLPAKGETENFLGCTLRRGRYIVHKGRGKKRPPEMRPLMSMTKIDELTKYATRDIKITWEVFKRLLPRLSNPAIELRVADHCLRMFTQPALETDAVHGNTLIVGMQQECDAAVAATGVQPAPVLKGSYASPADQLSGNIAFHRLMEQALLRAGDQPQKYMKVMKAGWVFGLAKEDPEKTLLLAHPSEEVRTLIKAREAIKSWPLHISRVRKILAMARACGGLMPVPLGYHAAHTGRYGGREDINLQNLPKRGHPLVLGLRGLLVPPPGQRLVVVDLSAIEARVLAWVAGQTDLLHKFATGSEIYCDLAEKILGLRCRKARKTDPDVIRKVYTERRGFGKVAVLGCGYGMGADRMIEYAAGPGFDLTLTKEAAKRIVDIYRQANPAVTTFWRNSESAFTYVAKYKRPCGVPYVGFHSDDGIDVVITLPNGRRMNYHRVAVGREEVFGGDTLKVYNDLMHTWDHVWGGVITENIVQAISRDVLVEAMLRLEDSGHHTCLSVHDELVMVAPPEQAERMLATAIKEMSRPPTWAPDLPLAAEGVVCDRYGLH